MARVERKIALFPRQIDFLNASEREVLLDSGIGFGKTKVGALWLCKMVMEYPKTRWLMVARDVPQLRNAVIHELKQIMNEWLGWQENVHYTYHRGFNEFNFANGSSIIGVGATNYDSAFRGPSYSGGLFDEVDYYKPDAYLALRGRIRVAPELIRFVSSPKGFNHVYEDFYANKKHFQKVINATTFDNPTLSQGYLDSLKSIYSPRLYEQEVLGKRLNLNVGKVYDEFDREKHVKPCKHLLTDKHTLYFFTDYNISNYCGNYQFFDAENKKLYIIGEEHLKFQGTEVMAPRVATRFKGHRPIVMGDSTGNNKRDVAIVETNYEIFARYGLPTKSANNPPVQSRIISANSNFFHENVIIDPDCKSLIRDLELLSWLENGKDIDKRDISLSHASDAATYGIWYFLPAIPDKRTSSTRIL